MSPNSSEDDSQEKPPALSVSEVASLVQSILKDNGPTIPSNHFGKRGHRRDFNTQDARAVLRTGSVLSTPRWNEKVEDWNYDIAGLDREGELLTVRIAFNSLKTGIILVTAF